MEEKQIQQIIEKQREYFKSGATTDVNCRIKALKALKAAIIENEEKITEAIKADLGKSGFESYMCEIGLTLSEITYMLKHIRRFSRDRRAATPLAHFHSKSFVKPSPYGVVLIMSPWNYPFMLTLEPLVDAIAAGNTAVIKPSAYSPNTSRVIKELIESCFEPEYVSVITGGRAENTFLLNQHFDYIFFTGSQAVGKEVMAKAANHLTPVTLELGGKSPCIICEDADVKLAAKRVVFGKYLNCGQTCVAPDYVYCHESIRDKFIEEVKKQIVHQFGEDAFANPDYGKIISEKHFNRINGLIDCEKVVYGGRAKADSLQIEPTVMKNVSFDDKIMQEEIFGPVMPIIDFSSIDDVIKRINDMQHPLALYIFTKSKKTAKLVTSLCGFGGGCINDTIIHLATSNMGFGGFGESGMGAYHGKLGFDTFSHLKSIVDKKQWIDMPMRYQKYNSLNEKLIRIFLK